MESTSTVTNNKRARTQSPSPSSQRTSEQPLNYHPSFPRTDLSDVLLESSDAFHLATSRIYLQASSSVFKDALLVGTDDSSEHLDGLVLIRLQETAADLSLFLAFVQANPAVEPSSVVKLVKLDTLLSICDKFDAPLVGRAIVRQFFPSLVDEKNLGMSQSSLPDIFAVALIHPRFGTDSYTRSCLVQMATFGAASDPTQAAGKKGWRPFNVEDFALRYLKRMAVEDIVSFSKVRTKATMQKGYTWE